MNLLPIVALHERLRPYYPSTLIARARQTRRVRTPTVLQLEAVECGAAALAIILGYYRRHVTLEELRITCGVSRDGSNAANLLKAARSYGLLAKGFKKEPDALHALPLPQVVFWNFNHFVVVEGFGPGRVYINDPGSGPRAIDADEFNQSFTGVVLLFECGPTFQAGGARPSLVGALQSRLAGSWTLLVFVLLATLGLAAPGVIVAALAQLFVDRVLVAGAANWAWPLLSGLALAAALRAALTWLQESALLQLETRLAVQGSGRFFWHVLHLPIAFFTQRYAGDVAGRVAITERLAQLLGGELAITALSLLLIGVYGALMLSYDVPLTLLAFVVALLNIGVLRAIARQRVDANQRLQNDHGKLLGATYAGLELIETIKASGAEADNFARWSGYQAKVVGGEQRLGVVSQALAVLPPLLAALNTAAILVVGGLRVMEGQLSLGMLVAFQSLVASFLLPVGQLMTFSGTLQEARADLLRLDDVLAYPQDAGIPPTHGPIVASVTPLSGQVEMRDVTFGYSRAAPALIEGLSLTLRPGGSVALVGGSGSGKSTVARLVAGLYQPWEGEMVFDGQPRAALPRAALTSTVSFVDQEIALFADTVRNNLTLWDASVSEAALLEALRDAELYDDIMARPDGLDERLASSGHNLSGGQRQRLEIARALVSQPRLLLLDEATSALDPLVEQAIARNLRRRGCACLIVAHRLSTIRDADEIIVLERGKVVERGSHQTLVELDGQYARLIRAEAPQPLVDAAPTTI